ncbi:uncharacterized protein BKCO1_8400023 [Diplodia corticola]|uniref:Uncharacterized protein n=1 Tax=Diplodia corticola TaxID=236234 RepID=A0A1J9QLI3_9PEZI|nr:uncharacterized protein BKCO1_8400023 [Diplodia corticola]OJD29313.1 hypothetical protein BKCO1_8400023 [Diplodia corticola]
MNLRNARERRAPRRFEDELDQIYAPEEGPEPRVIHPTSRSGRPTLHIASTAFNPNVRPAAFPSLPLGGGSRVRSGGGGGGGGAGEGEDASLEDSLVVRLRLDKDERPVSLRDLVEREDDRMAEVWLRARRRGMETDDSAGSRKAKLSELHPIMRSTVIGNMYIAALDEGFQDPCFPIQHILDMSAEDAIKALDVIEDSYLDGDYPACLSSPTMLGNLLQAHRFLMQQKWPRRFLKPVDLKKCTPNPGRRVEDPHIPKGVRNMTAEHCVFFGKQKAVFSRELRNPFLIPRDVVPGQAESESLQGFGSGTPWMATDPFSLGLKECAQRSRLKFGEWSFPVGTAQQDLQHLRSGERQGQSLVREEQAASSPSTSQQHFDPQLVHFLLLSQSNIGPVATPALSQGPSAPTSPDTPAYSTAWALLRQMSPSTAPSSPSPSDLPSAIYGPSLSFENSEAEVLSMLGATASAAVPHISCSSSSLRGDDLSPSATGSTPTIGLTPDNKDEDCITFVRYPHQRLLMTQTPPSTPMAMGTEPSSPSLQRLQRQQLSRQRPVLAASSSSAMLHLFERNYHRHIQEQQAAQALTQVTSLQDVLTTERKDQQEHGQHWQGQQHNGWQHHPQAASSTVTIMADNNNTASSPPPVATATTPQPNTPDLCFSSSSAASRTDTAAFGPPPPASSYSFNIAAATAAAAAPIPAVAITPPSTIPVAPMLTTITTTTKAATNNTATATTTTASHSQQQQKQQQQQQQQHSPAFPNTRRKRSTTVTPSTTSTNRTRPSGAASCGSSSSNMPPPPSSSERARGTGNGHRVGNIIGNRNGGRNSNGNGHGHGNGFGFGLGVRHLRQRHNYHRRGGRGGRGGVVVVRPQLAMASGVAREGDGGGDVDGLVGGGTTASLRGGENGGGGGDGGGGEEEEEEEEEVVVQVGVMEEEREERAEVEGGKKPEAKDPYGMFMKGVVEYAGDD